MNYPALKTARFKPFKNFAKRLSIAASLLFVLFALVPNSEAQEIKFETSDGKFKITGTVGYYVANGKPVASPKGDEKGLAVVIIRPDGKPTNPVPVKMLSKKTKQILFGKPSPPLVKAPTNGLIAYFPLDGNAKNAVRRGDDAVIEGATLCEDRHGRKENALQFDGIDDRLVIREKNKLDIFGAQKPLTISMWFAPENEDSVLFCKGFHTVFHATNNGVNRGNRYCQIIVGNFSPNAMLYKSQPATATYAIANDFKVTLSQWNHIAFVRDKVPRIYINGRDITNLRSSLKNTWSADYDELLNGDSITFGATQLLNRADEIYWENFFAGKLDDIRIYNRALKADEIAKLFQEDASKK